MLCLLFLGNNLLDKIDFSAFYYFHLFSLVNHADDMTWRVNIAVMDMYAR